MAVLRIAVILVLIYHLAGAGCSSLSTSEHQKKKVAIINNDRGLKSSHKWPTCSLWKYHKYNNSSCECGSEMNHILYCYENPLPYAISLASCYCISHSDNGDGQGLVVGACPFLCGNYLSLNLLEDTNISTLCDRYIRQNRQGQMCGQCKDNHSPSPYSYELKCIHCAHYEYNWLKYLAMAYGPLTVFVFVVIIFRFNALSASMNAFIFFCQVVSCPAAMSLISKFVNFPDEHPADRDVNIIVGIAQVMTTIFGIWNLDFLRMIYKPFCLDPQLSIIQLMCLEYVVAVYPLLLILATYMIFKLYKRFDVIQSCFKPLVWLCARFNYQWSRNASSSLIEAFATFIILGYVKIINTSFDTLMPVRVRNVTGQTVGMYTYYNGSMEYFGHDHLPYAVLGIFMFIAFILVPFFLLCLYPCRCFQSCLNRCKLNSQVLCTFMDAFQGHYKLKPYDCRYWAAFYLFLRIVALVLFAATRSGLFIAIGGIMLIPVIVLFAIIRPYRETVYNVVDIVLLLAFVQTSFSTTGILLSILNRQFQGFAILMLGIGLVIPVIYITTLAMYKILPKSWIIYMKKCALHLVPCTNRACLHMEEDTEDRLITSEESVDFERTLLLHEDMVHYNNIYTN